MKPEKKREKEWTLSLNILMLKTLRLIKISVPDSRRAESAHWSLSCKGSQCPIWCTKMSGRQRRVVVPVTAVLIAGLTMDAALLKKRGKLSQSRATLAVQEKAVAMDYMDRFRLMIEIGHREQEYFDVALREHQRSTASGDGDD